MYRHGNGVTKDFVLAHMWFNLALGGLAVPLHRLGVVLWHARAQYNLGIMYDNGEGESQTRANRGAVRRVHVGPDGTGLGGF